MGLIKRSLAGLVLTDILAMMPAAAFAHGGGGAGDGGHGEGRGDHGFGGDHSGELTSVVQSQLSKRSYYRGPIDGVFGELRKAHEKRFYGIDRKD